MISAENYFKIYLAYELGIISNTNLNMHDQRYESYRGLHTNLLEFEAKNNGNPGAIEELGERALFEDEDVNKAIEYLVIASEKGHADATALLAQIYFNDNYGMKDLDKYFKYLQLSAEQGSAVGMYNLSCAYYKGKEAYDGYGFETDKALSFKLCYDSAKRLRDILEVLFTNNCGQSFVEYIEDQMVYHIQYTVACAQTLLDGDGVTKDIEGAKKLLIETREFYLKYIGETIEPLEKIIQELETN